jgi:outer membrane protein
VATLPDVLEARAATAQVEYDLQADGALEIALGNPSTWLGLSPSTTLQVQPLDQLIVPDELPDSVEEIREFARHSPT